RARSGPPGRGSRDGLSVRTADHAGGRGCPRPRAGATPNTPLLTAVSLTSSAAGRRRGTQIGSRCRTREVARGPVGAQFGVRDRVVAGAHIPVRTKERPDGAARVKPAAARR